MDDDNHKAYLRIPEAAARLDVARNTISNAIHAGKLTAYKVLGTYRIKPEDLDAFIRSCRVEARVREAPPPAPKVAARARTFKHLDGQRSLDAWRRRGEAVDPPGGHSAPSSRS